MFDLYGYFVPPERRGPPITLYRGCFVLDMLKVGGFLNVGKFCIYIIAFQGFLLHIRLRAGILLVLQKGFV